MLLLIAASAACIIWNIYITGPWTRDGRVRVQVAAVAPQVAGRIIEVHIADDQFVHKGDILFVIEPIDYRIALLTATAVVKERAADLQVKRLQAERRLHLNDLATTAEEQQVYEGQATEAEALYEAALQQQAQARINLVRTEVRSPVNGFVTNLLMRVGDYAHTGVASAYIIDSDSYWVDGYFEETKLAHLCVGDPVDIKLLGFSRPARGIIETVTRGISVADATPSIQGLASVNAVYTWVRLAQRVPVRIRITHMPPGVPLIAGLTATIVDRAAEPGVRRSALSWMRRQFVQTRENIFGGFTPPAGCIPPVSGASAADATLPTPVISEDVSPNRINPGLAPGLNRAPEAP